MRSWRDAVSLSVFIGVPFATYLFAPRYWSVVEPLVIAGCVSYLWYTRWRHGDY